MFSVVKKKLKHKHRKQIVMKWIYTLSLITAAAIFLPSCTKKLNGSGNYITQDRTIGAFTGVENDGDFEVILEQKATHSLSINAEDNILSEIETVVVNGILKIYFRRNNVSVRHGQILVTVGAPMLKNLYMHGSGVIKSDAIWKAENLQLSVSGSGSILLESLVENQAVATISGSGSIVMDGSAQYGNFNISGSGKISGFNYNTKEADITISGSGNCEVQVANKLMAFISGSGSVFYKGNPQVNSSISGSGKVIKQ